MNTRATLLTLPEVATSLAISVRQLRKLVDCGEIAAINIGLGKTRACLRIEQEALRAFIGRRQQGWQKPKAHTATPKPVNGTMTSSSGVIDFAEKQAQRASAKRKPL